MPGSSARFVGRVGALAVALGIGAALANSPGLALADDGAAGTSTGPKSTTADTPSTAADASKPPASKTGEGTSAADRHGTAKDQENGTEHRAGDKTPADDLEDTTTDAGVDPDAAKDTRDADKTTETGHRRSHRPPVGAVAPKENDTTSAPTPKPKTRPAADPDASQRNSLQAHTSTGASDHVIEQASPPAAEAATLTRLAVEPPASPPTTAVTGLGGLVHTVLSALGFGPQAGSTPGTPAPSPMGWAMLGWVRREVGQVTAPHSAASAPVPTLMADNVSDAAVSPLGTDEQLQAERIATQTVNTLPVALMKLILRQQFLAAANQQYGSVDNANMARLNEAVDEYAMGAAFQQELLDSMNPSFVTQVAPPHAWFGQDVPGSRILYDNPDTVYRFAGVNGASQYEIRGRFLNYDPNDPSTRPADTTFSVLEGIGGTTSSILTVDDNFQIADDGSFVITMSTAPTGGPNHLQLTTGSTILAARNTLGDWNTEDPMLLSITRVGGPPDSLFAQFGGFAFLGKQIAGNPLLTALVSLIPPLPYVPPVLRGAVTALILLVRGNEQSKYMALASAGEPNTVSPPSSNAEFLANQLQSNGHFDLTDDQYLVLEIDPGSAGYFIVPTYDIWTITGDYRNDQTSLNNEQALVNPDNRTYTVVISKSDPGVANWVSTGGLNQGSISIRFQDLGPDAGQNPPRIISQQVVTREQVAGYFPGGDPAYFVDEQGRRDQLALRQAGYDRRWAPFPQL